MEKYKVDQKQTNVFTAYSRVVKTGSLGPWSRVIVLKYTQSPTGYQKRTGQILSVLHVYIYHISSYSFCGNYSFLDLENVIQS